MGTFQGHFKVVRTTEYPRAPDISRVLGHHWLESGLVWGWIRQFFQSFASLFAYLWVNYPFLLLWAVQV